MACMAQRVFTTAALAAERRRTLARRLQYQSFGNRADTRQAWLPHQFPAEPARVVLLCASQTGYQNLCQLITRFKMRETTES